MSTAVEPPQEQHDALRLAVHPHVVLVGNPNVGKSVLFGALTKRYVTVSNYPGTTVTITRGKALLDGRRVDVLDTPGTNSLTPMSEDEEVTRNILLREPPGALLQVADAKNLRRALILSSQIAEMGLPFALDLNMMDEAGDLGLRIDRERLEELLGVAVVATVAVRRKGFDAVERALFDQRHSALQVRYPDAIEKAIAEMEPVLPQTHVARRALAIMLLSGDSTLNAWLRERIGEAALEALRKVRAQAQERLREPLGGLIHKHRLREIDKIMRQVEVRPRQRIGSLADTLGSLSMHPVWGVPVLLVVLWGMYQFVGVLGAGTLVDLLETKVFGEHLSPWAIRAADTLLPFPHRHGIEEGVLTSMYTHPALGTGQEVLRFIHDFLVGPYGQITMALSYAIALILPIVATFFIAFGILEDSGYLPRLAVMVNRLFRTMGLNGKAVLPMVLGLGCDTMATLTTRILETRKERVLVTLLLALGVPCSAQLGVILGMMRALSLSATLVWLGSIFATLFIVGWAASKVVPGRGSDFVLELPPIRRPQLGNMVVKTLARIEWYLREAAPLFLLGTLMLFLFDRLRLLEAIERAAAPLVVGILGLPARAAEAFLVGFLRRDYGAAGLYDMAREGELNDVQLVVSMVTITLFVPCIANFLIMIKERGMRTALAMVAFIVPFALVVGGALNLGLRLLGVTF
ncbi:MAG: ferrous iron transport protein B [Candidatus Latescibacterota bacterium]|nr:MAG: ferrous iron transport protein B [Candidatus Latescibacterota bacterium]